MTPIIDFFKHNNARIGQTIGLLSTFLAVRGIISLQTLEFVGMVMTVWGAGSWVQGAKNGFKPKPPGAE